MIRQYIVELESRVKNLQQLIGNPKQYQSESRSCKQNIDQLVSKKISTNKQVSRKYQKLSNYVQKYSDVLDNMYTVDKLNIVIDELDSLQQTSQTLNKIEKNLGALDTADYNQNVSKYANFDVLNTVSSVKQSNQNNKFDIVKYQSGSLSQLLEDERKDMNAIMELNYRIINNINQKIKLVYTNKIKNKK